VSDKRRLREPFEDRFKLRRQAWTPRALIVEVIHLLKVNQDRHAQFGRKRVATSRFGTIRAEVVFDLAEPSRAALDCLSERIDALLPRQISAGEPGESARRSGLQSGDRLGGGRAREQVGLHNPGTVKVRDIVRRAPAHVEV
jgi:hypothetical protein